jgi:EpsI family protein
LLPRKFDSWEAAESSGLVSPEQAGKLARTLYQEIVELIYRAKTTGAEVMMLAAYGDTQSELLQLHRPEVCYPAVGFSLAMSEPGELALGPDAKLPVRRVVATREGRRENIVYWTRLGERLPQSDRDQRTARLQDGLEGLVSDGILMRFSIIGESKASFAILESFVPRLLQAVSPAQRSALIGSQLAAKLDVHSPVTPAGATGPARGA